MIKYKLKGKEVVPCELWEWALAIEREPVAQTHIRKDVRVSTVFIGLDHNFARPGKPPLVFETMVFGGHFDANQCRHATWDEAAAMHAAICKAVRRGETKLDDITHKVTDL